MPIGGPAFVHDLTGEHGLKIEGFLAHRQEDIPFPVLHLRGVAGEEPEQVIFGFRRDRGLLPVAGEFRFRTLAGQGFEASAKRVGRRMRFRLGQIGRIAFPVQPQLRIDVLFQRQRRIQHPFHPFDAVHLDGMGDLVGMRSGLFDDMVADLLLTGREQRIVLGEIGMTQDMGHHQGVFLQGVGVGQIGAAGIARKDHLEHPRVAHAVLYQLMDIAYPERPMRHTHRQPVDRDLQHERRRHHLELHRVVIQALVTGQGLH